MSDDRAWLVHSADGSCGPYTESEILEFRAQGIVTDESYLWREGMPEWTRLAEIPAFAPSPPPQAPSPPTAPPPPAFAPAPVIGPLPASPLPEFLRQGPPPAQEVAALPEEPAPRFSTRQLQAGLAGVVLALLIVAIGAVPRPWWETPALAFAIFGAEPEAPEGAEEPPPSEEEERRPSRRGR